MVRICTTTGLVAAPVFASGRASSADLLGTRLGAWVVSGSAGVFEMARVGNTVCMAGSFSSVAPRATPAHRRRRVRQRTCGALPAGAHPGRWDAGPGLCPRPELGRELVGASRIRPLRRWLVYVGEQPGPRTGSRLRHRVLVSIRHSSLVRQRAGRDGMTLWSWTDARSRCSSARRPFSRCSRPLACTSPTGLFLSACTGSRAIGHLHDARVSGSGR